MVAPLNEPEFIRLNTPLQFTVCPSAAPCSEPMKVLNDLEASVAENVVLGERCAQAMTSQVGQHLDLQVAVASGSLVKNPFDGDGPINASCCRSGPPGQWDSSSFVIRTSIGSFGVQPFCPPGQWEFSISSTAVDTFDDSGMDSDSCCMISVEDEAESTTLIMQQIPGTYSRAMLLALLDTHGFRSSYDLVYIPSDFRTGRSYGYAFINLVSRDAAEAFIRAFDGFEEWESGDRQACSVTFAAYQVGLDGLVARYRNAPMMHRSVSCECKPALFVDGVQVPFPAPTQAVKKPRPPRGRHQVVLDSEQ